MAAILGNMAIGTPMRQSGFIPNGEEVRQGHRENGDAPDPSRRREGEKEERMMSGQIEGTGNPAQQGAGAEDLRGLSEQVAALRDELDSMRKSMPEEKLAMVVFSGDLDKAIASFVIATGAVAMGMDVVMFFTFWGTPLLRDKGKKAGGKDFMSKMFARMLPKGVGGAKLSQMNMGGMGTAMIKSLMKKKNVSSLDQMLDLAEELGVRIFVCEMSMDLMGFKREEMITYEGLTFCGVAKFLEEAKSSKVQLFI